MAFESFQDKGFFSLGFFGFFLGGGGGGHLWFCLGFF